MFTSTRARDAGCPITVPRRPPVLEGVGPDRGLVCPLERTRVHGEVVGIVASVKVEQLFRNPLGHPIEAIYVFPLPPDAAVDTFEFEIDGRRIVGEVREREEARGVYEEARESGRRAGLLEQERPNVFTVSLANIAPGAAVTARITYLEALPYSSGRFTFRFPMVVATRYVPPGSDPVEADRIAPPLAPARAGHTIELALTVRAGLPIESWSCATHTVVSAQPAPDRLELTLAGTAGIPDRDFVVEYEVGGAATRLGLICHRPDPAAPGTFFLYAVPPSDVSTGEIRPKELIFLLDRSGSMDGGKMDKAREALRGCLRALNPNDTFHIIAFDDRMEPFTPAPVPFSDAHMARAESYLAAITARGGTEIAAPLASALGLPGDPARQRVVVLITDGQVSNESALIDLVRQRLGSARLHTFGIDTAVNAFLIERLARLGKGSSELLLPTQDIEAAIAQFVDRVGSPLLTDPIADFGTVRVSEVAPHPLPDLFAGQVLAIAGHYRGAGPTRVTFAGQGPGRLIEHAVEVDFPQVHAGDAVVQKVWARLMIDRLEEDLRDDPRSGTLRQKIVTLAVQHGLMSSLTACVAVDRAPADAPGRGRPVAVHVPVELPAGWTRPGPADMMQARQLAAPSLLLGSRAPTAGLAAPATMAPMAPAFDLDELSADVSFSRPPPRRASKAPGDGRAPAPAPAPAGPYPSAPAGRAALTGGLPGEAGTELGSLIEALAGGSAAAPRREAEARRDPIASLRMLAKEQRADGSWGGAAETALAVLAFLRHGHTDRAGTHTSQLRRAVEQLERHFGPDGLPAEPERDGPLGQVLATLALVMLARATGSPRHLDVAARACSGLAGLSGAAGAFALTRGGTPAPALSLLAALALSCAHDLALPGCAADPFAATASSSGPEVADDALGRIARALAVRDGRIVPPACGSAHGEPVPLGRAVELLLD